MIVRTPRVLGTQEHESEGERQDSRTWNIFMNRRVTCLTEQGPVSLKVSVWMVWSKITVLEGTERGLYT